MALFHADRAEALLFNDPEREIDAIAKVVAALAHYHEHEYPIPEDSIMTVLARVLCAQQAFSDRPGIGALDTARHDLLDCLSARKWLPGRHSMHALLRVFDYSIDPPTDVRRHPRASDLLEALRFGAVGQYNAAQCLLRYADEDPPPLDEESDSSPDLFTYPRQEARTAAVRILTTLCQTAIERGSAGVLSTRARRTLADLDDKPRSIVGTDSKSSSFEAVMEHVETLVVSLLAGEHLSQTEIGRLWLALKPITTYLGTPVGDRAAHSTAASSENYTIVFGTGDTHN
jgi:hypothetical protein